MKLSRLSILKNLAREVGIEPTPRVLETLVLPLNYSRILNNVRGGKGSESVPFKKGIKYTSNQGIHLFGY